MAWGVTTGAPHPQPQHAAPTMSLGDGTPPCRFGLPRDLWTSAAHVSVLHLTAGLSQLVGLACVGVWHDVDAVATLATSWACYNLLAAVPSGMAAALDQLCPQVWDADARSIIPPMFLRRCLGFALLFVGVVVAAAVYFREAYDNASLFILATVALPCAAVQECCARYLLCRQYGRRTTFTTLTTTEILTFVLFTAGSGVAVGSFGPVGVPAAYAVLRCGVPAAVLVAAVVRSTEGQCRTVLLKGGAFINLHGIDKGNRAVLQIGVPSVFLVFALRLPFDGFLCLPPALIDNARVIAFQGVCVAGVKVLSTLSLLASQAVTGSIGRRLSEGNSGEAAAVVPIAVRLARVVAGVVCGLGAGVTAVLVYLGNADASRVCAAVTAYLVADTVLVLGTGVLRGASSAPAPLDLSRRPAGRYYILFLACMAAPPAFYLGIQPRGLPYLWSTFALAQALSAAVAWYRVYGVAWSEQTAYIIGEHTPLNPSKRLGRIIPSYLETV